MYFFLFSSLQIVVFRQNPSYTIFIKRNKVSLYFELQMLISRKFCRGKKITGILFYIYRDILTLFLAATYKKLIKQKHYKCYCLYSYFSRSSIKFQLQFHQLYLKKIIKPNLFLTSSPSLTRTVHIKMI
jgi:hypothetical protein